MDLGVGGPCEREMPDKLQQDKKAQSMDAVQGDLRDRVGFVLQYAAFLILAHICSALRIEIAADSCASPQILFRATSARRPRNFLKAQ